MENHEKVVYTSVLVSGNEENTSMESTMLPAQQCLPITKVNDGKGEEHMVNAVEFKKGDMLADTQVMLDNKAQNSSNDTTGQALALVLLLGTLTIPKTLLLLCLGYTAQKTHQCDGCIFGAMSKCPWQTKVR
eukprot:4634927-Ditylum_brightwellii.AAC.2